MKNLLKLLPFILLLGIIWGCNEDILVEPTQYGSITGQVLNKKDGQPVSRAAVTLTPSGRTVKTDTTGRFRFDTIQAGKYTLKVVKETYRDEITTAEVVSNYGTVTILYLKNENHTPTEPLLVAPTEGTKTVATTTVLKWKATDADQDLLTYDVVIQREGSTTPTQRFSSLKADSLVLNDLDYGTTYTWQVTVSDGVSSVASKMGSFRTDAFPSISYVFTRKINRNYQIFAATSGGRAIQLTSKGSNWRPVISPNRKQIAFISNVETTPHLFVMNIDGTHLHHATTTVPISGLMLMDLSFCWSPDGTELLYPSNDKLYAVRADGSGNGLRKVSQASAGRFFAGCDWTPQGNRIIARTTGSSVYDNRFVVMSPNGTDTTTVLNKTDCRVGNPVFSVTGKTVLYTYDKDNYQDVQGRQLNAQLALLNLTTKVSADITGEGTNAKSTKPGGTNDLEPHFSPDGAKIIFTNVSNTGTGECTVTMLDLDGHTGQNRTSLIESAEMPCWR